MEPLDVVAALAGDPLALPADGGHGPEELHRVQRLAAVSLDLRVDVGLWDARLPGAVEHRNDREARLLATLLGRYELVAGDREIV
jgi:hypothetical protein